MPFTILVIFLFQNNFVFGLTNAPYLNGALPLFQIDHGSKPHCKYLTEYFAFLHEFAKMGSNECQFLLRINAISVMVAFFMRHKAQENYVSVRSMGYIYILLLGCRQCFWVVYCVIWLYTLFLGCILCYRFSTLFMGGILHFWFFSCVVFNIPVLYTLFLRCITCPWLVHTVLNVYILSVIAPGLDPWVYTQTFE